MALFGNKEEKAAQDAAAKAEAERLLGLPVADMGAELMPVFGPKEGESPGLGSGKRLNILQISSWIVFRQPRSGNYLKELQQPVREGLQALEQAGLIEKRNIQGGGVSWSSTRLGEQALADGSVSTHLWSHGGPCHMGFILTLATRPSRLGWLPSQ